MNDAAADGSTGAETFASQYANVRIADERAHLVRQQLNGPSVAA